MPLSTIAVWAAVVVALGMLVELVVVLGRAAREGLRVKQRTDGYAAIVAVHRERAEREAARLEAAAAAVPLLRARAETAIATIRRGVLPPGLIPAIRIALVATRGLTHLIGR